MASFDETYPHVARWVKEHGWIELGYDGMSRSWIRALDEGGLIWEGGDASESVDIAFQQLEAALTTWLREQFGT